MSRDVESGLDKFMDLVRDCEPSLRRLVFRMVGTADAMEDVLQTALVRAYQAYPNARLVHAGSGARWLHTIAYNACVDELRRRRRVAEIAAAAGQAAETESAHLMQGSVFDSTSGVGDAVRALPDELRACVVVVYVLGFSYRDASEILAIPEGTLASRLHAARAELRTALGPSSRTSPKGTRNAD